MKSKDKKNKYPKAFTNYSKTIEDADESLEDYNLTKESVNSV